MAFIPVPNVAQLMCEGSVDRQMTINDLYFEVSGGGITVVNLSTIVSAVHFWFTTLVAPLLSRDWTTIRTRARDLTTQNSFVAEAAGAVVGGVDEEAAPNNVAACIKLGTAVSGRSFRGRNYIPALPNSLVNLNTLDATFAANLIGVYAGLVGPGTFEPGWQLVVVSRFTGGGPGVPSAPRVTGIATPVQQVSFPTPFVKSMRSREVGHGK